MTKRSEPCIMGCRFGNKLRNLGFKIEGITIGIRSSSGEDDDDLIECVMHSKQGKQTIYMYTFLYHFHVNMLLTSHFPVT